ncbi:MAG: four helix bundle protein [Prevotellaceae bacterium]|jgi:four helix bundle protein|nr:four helix bundle protein [Prevotellaceae bacterium]
MASGKTFEDLEIWKAGMQLVCDVYEAFKKCNDFGLKDQMQRAAVSIPSNISEGFERSSDKEFIRFLYIAKASCGELRTQLYIAVKLNYIEKLKGDALITRLRTLSSQIASLITYRQKRNNENPSTLHPAPFPPSPSKI